MKITGSMPSIRQIGEKRVLPVGAVLFQEGDLADNAYLIERGALEIYVLQDQGRVLLDTLGPGEVVGELALIDDAPRSASVVALRETVLLTITKSFYADQISRTEPILRHFLHIVLERMRKAERRYLRRLQEPTPATRQAKTQSELHQLLSLQEEILRAVHSEEFILHYQPIVRLSDGVITGFEALLRWQHPQRGLTMPVNFIGAAEIGGLIVPIGNWIFRRAIEDLGLMRDAAGARGLGGKDLPSINVNLSYRQFFDNQLLETLAQLLRDKDLPSGSIIAEVTENLFINDPEAAKSYLSALRELGVGIALDDFGTGYSSLTHLHKFPLDKLKIDRDFVSSMQSDPKAREIVRSLCGLSERLGLDLVAEGVEDKEGADTLSELGCTHGQGYFFSRPISLQHAIRLLREGGHWQHAQA